MLKPYEVLISIIQVVYSLCIDHMQVIVMFIVPYVGSWLGDNYEVVVRDISILSLLLTVVTVDAIVTMLILEDLPLMVL